MTREVHMNCLSTSMPPSPYITPGQVGLDPELISPEGRWDDAVHQVDPEDAGEARARCWHSGCSRQNRRLLHVLTSLNFPWQPFKLPQQLPCPALPCPACLLCSHQMFSPVWPASSLAVSWWGGLLCHALLPPLGARAQKHPWMLFA